MPQSPLIIGEDGTTPIRATPVIRRAVETGAALVSIVNRQFVYKQSARSSNEGSCYYV